MATSTSSCRSYEVVTSLVGSRPRVYCARNCDLRRPGLEYANLDQQPCEIVDAPLVNDFAVLQFVHEHARALEMLPAGRDAEERADVRPFKGQDLRDTLPVNQHGVDAGFQINERIKPGANHGVC